MMLSNVNLDSYLTSYFVGKKVKAKWTVEQEEFVVTEVVIKIKGTDVNARVRGKDSLWFDDGDWEFVQ